MHAYPDDEVSHATSTVVSRYLWYLSKVLIPLSFFDEKIPIEQKQDMVAAMNEREGSVDPQKQILASSLSNPMATTLPDLFSKTSRSLFQITCLEAGFLSSDPEQWSGDACYEASRAFVSALHVTNDVAECAFALMKDFNKSLTWSEEKKKQYVLQVIEQHLQRNPHP